MVSIKKSSNGYQIYCGLSDGSLGVIDMNTRDEPTGIYEICISKFPISAIEIVMKELNCYLWISSHNFIYILEEQ